MAVRRPRNDPHLTAQTHLSWLALSSASTESQHDIRTGNPQLFPAPSLQTRSIKGPWPLFFASSLSQFLLSKHIPSTPPLLSFFYRSHFLPHRDLSERQRIPSVANTAWPAATQEAFDSCWNVPSFGKLSNSVDTMLVLKHNSTA